VTELGGDVVILGGYRNSSIYTKAKCFHAFYITCHHFIISVFSEGTVRRVFRDVLCVMGRSLSEIDFVLGPPRT